MAFRDKAKERMQPFLEPGEQIQEVFWVRTGPRPYWMALSCFILFATQYHVVAVTDRAIVVAGTGRWSVGKPRELVARLPRALALGPAKGLWYGPLYLTPDGKKSWAPKVLGKAINAADEALAASGIQPIGHAGQPPQPGTVPGPGTVPPPNAGVPAQPPPPPPPTGQGASF